MSDKAYVIVHLQVTDFDRYFSEYIPGTLASIQKHGGGVLVATNDPETAEGEVSGNWHVVLEFPSMADAKAWYDCDEYQPVKALRMNELTTGGSLSFAPAFQPPG